MRDEGLTQEDVDQARAAAELEVTESMEKIMGAVLGTPEGTMKLFDALSALGTLHQQMLDVGASPALAMTSLMSSLVTHLLPPEPTTIPDKLDRVLDLLREALHDMIDAGMSNSPTASETFRALKGCTKVLELAVFQIKTEGAS